MAISVGESIDRAMKGARSATTQHAAENIAMAQLMNRVDAVVRNDVFFGLFLAVRRFSQNAVSVPTERALTDAANGGAPIVSLGELALLEEH